MMLKWAVRYHRYLLSKGEAWSEENPLNGLYRVAMPWLLAMLGLSISGMAFDPENVPQLIVMMAAWGLAAFGLFYAIVAFGAGAIGAHRARQRQKADDR
ncbi:MULTISPECIES: hypothetical protein [unclassified Brevundimonas]|uniref:hypothetical protein n=1 Tax=unclassified Brevundimonas TaxID=2622653 RepID=UPI003F8FB177